MYRQGLLNEAILWRASNSRLQLHYLLVVGRLDNKPAVITQFRSFVPVQALWREFLAILVAIDYAWDALGVGQVSSL